MSKVPFSKSNDEAQDKQLLEPMLYLLQIPGKNVRKKLLHAFNVWTNVDDTKVREIGELVQMLHNASLLLDDIEDNSVLRRGKKIVFKSHFSILLTKCWLLTDVLLMLCIFTLIRKSRCGKVSTFKCVLHVTFKFYFLL